MLACYKCINSFLPQLIFSFVGHTNASELMNTIYFKWKQVVQLRTNVPPVLLDPPKRTPSPTSTPNQAVGGASEKEKESNPSELSTEIEHKLCKELEDEFEPMNLSESQARIRVPHATPKGKKKKGSKKNKDRDMLQGWEEVSDTRPFEDIHGDLSEQELEKKWEAYFLIYGRGVCMLQTPALKNLIRLGIPASLRKSSMRKMLFLCFLY